MEKNGIDVYYVNKFSWLGKDPMAAVSTMLLYALAKTGVKANLIAEGDEATSSDALLQERFGLRQISNFHVHLFKRTFFNAIKCTPLFYLRACAYIVRNRRQDMKTLVLTRNTTFLPWLVALKWLFGCTVVFESHVYNGTCSLQGIPEPDKRKIFCMSNQYRIIERIFLNACDGLLCQSELQRELYAKDFVRIPAAVIPLGAQIHCTTSTGTVANNPPIKKKVAYIGNCFNYVDSNVILDALSLFNGLGVTLLWIGLQESEQERIKNDARIRGIDALCDLRGWMPHQSMIELLRNEAGAGIVLYKPSLHIAMVSPTKIFDYFAAGLPVIGPNMPSVANYVRNGEEGVLYESENALSLAEALETVFENETTYHKMRAHATAAAKKCSWENRADALRSFVDKFI